MNVDIKQIILATMLSTQDNRVTTKELLQQFEPSIPQRSLQIHLNFFEEAGIITKIRRGQYELIHNRNKVDADKDDKGTPRIGETSRRLSFAAEASTTFETLPSTLEDHVLRYIDHDIMFKSRTDQEK